ncbi:MAG: phosphotransferase [Actinomycetia bacterium]|nr:phosphotransferase [Actinomycetes bacterium]
MFERVRSLDGPGDIERTAQGSGLIHADLMPENVLVHEGSPMVIDFDDSGYSWRLYDLATLLNFDVGEDGVEAMRESWLEGYRRVASMPESHLAHLPALIMARHLISLGWLHTRSETLTSVEMTGDVIELALFWSDHYLGS